MPEMGVVNVPVVPETLPAPPTTTQTEIAESVLVSTGNWIDLSKLTNTTFASMFGVTVEGIDFNAVYAVNKAALVNTADAGNRLQIQNSIDCANAAMYITDSSGNVLDTMIYSGSPSGDSVQIPTGGNYYVVIASDTGNAKIRKWDSSMTSTVGAVSWESIFGASFTAQEFWYPKNVQIPANGLSVYFTIPAGTAPFKLLLTSIETTTPPLTARFGTLSTTARDWTSTANYTWGIGGGLTCGYGATGVDLDVIPGETYFFNIRSTELVAIVTHLQAYRVYV